MKNASISEVSTVQSEDYAELATFLASFPAETRSKERWLGRFRIWWDINPAFAGAPSRGWILRQQEKIVGFLGTIPMKIQLGGKETICFGGTTWRVLPDHRGMSMFLKRRQMQDQKDHLHVTTTPRPEVAKMLELLRYQRIDRGGGTNEQSVVVLNFEKFLRMKFDGRFAGAQIAWGFALILQCFQSLFQCFTLGKSRRADVREISKADRAFDELWERTRSRYLNTNIRTSEMLNWYCFSAKEPAKTLLGYYEGDTLFGYMMLSSSGERAMQIMECVDLWIDPARDEVSTLRALVGKAVKYARRNSFDRLVFPHFNGQTAASYRKLHLLRRPAWGRREYMTGSSGFLENITVENSYFVTAQGDYGL
ncbi:MAG: hypothetical protein H0X66_04255 [Verrucomicrobia bacterium]|nr:hypothetical protein [Verrucomicrobiota bacterium]